MHTARTTMQHYSWNRYDTLHTILTVSLHIARSQLSTTHKLTDEVCRQRIQRQIQFPPPIPPNKKVTVEYKRISKV